MPLKNELSDTKKERIKTDAKHRWRKMDTEILSNAQTLRAICDKRLSLHALNQKIPTSEAMPVSLPIYSTHYKSSG